MTAYGTKEGVAAYARRYTSSGEWTNDTNPTLSAVDNWLVQLSSMLDTALAAKGFTVPMTDADAVKSATMVIEQLVSDLCKAANGTGRFFSERMVKGGMSQWRVITGDLNSWVEEYASGLEAQGATRGASEEMEIGYRDTNEAGDETFPIMQREAFGNRFTNWDTE